MNTDCNPTETLAEVLAERKALRKINADLLGGCKMALQTLSASFDCPHGNTANYLRTLIAKAEEK